MRINILLLFFLFSAQINAQKLFPVAPVHDEVLPQWAVEMYGPNPQVWRVDDGYRQWRKSRPDVKTTYSQYYKKWRRAAEPFVQPSGYIQKPSIDDNRAFQQRLAELKAVADRGVLQNTWTNIGPVETFNVNQGPDPLAKSEQANVYCFDQSLSHPDIVYCGTEGAEIFRSEDKGLNWYCVSRALDITSVTALEVHPDNPEIVLAGEGARIRLSVDGGQTWEIVFELADASPNEILFNPANPSIVLAATWKGLFRSEDGGHTWTNIFPEACYDIEWKVNDPSTLFAVRHNNADNICRFAISTDQGVTWTESVNGWFDSADPQRNDGGARIAVTRADPNRVYAILIGEGKAGDDGFIGLYRSDDGGINWTLPNPPAGGPYDEDQHPNMATIGNTGGYHQGFYNLGLDASDSNPDQVLVGFLRLWISDDGAASFDCIGGYCSNDFNYVHPDCQEIEINGDDVWMTSDGGIEYSSDFFVTHFARNRGVTSSDFWGFGTGWNEDIMVGGRYHNGNTALSEGWLPGESLGLGGGEAPTGYVNPGMGRIAYFSDIGGVAVPVEQNGFVEYIPAGKFPNESYYDAESGEMEWDPRSWNTIFVTHENKLWKTGDGGANWEALHVFGANANAQTQSFEISRSNPDVIYLFQRNEYSWDPGTLWKTTDGGQTWNTLNLPPGYARRMLLTLSPEDENLIWAAWPDGANGQKIFKSTNGGQTWQNLTTAALNDEHISYILHQGGTDGGVYVGTYRTIWYKNDQMIEWFPYNDGLPQSISTCILRPFYRDGKLRLGAYGKGIWEAPFFENSRPLAQPMISKYTTNCPNDSIQFDDYSMLNHAGATWLWQFPGGQPATSTMRNPKVVYQQVGQYSATLTVTNPQGVSTKTLEQIIDVQIPEINSLPVSNDFSTGLGDLTIVNPDADVTWEPVILNTCQPEGDTVYYVNNYVYSGYGIDDILFPVNLDLSQIIDPTLSFNVAYAPYYDGNFFIDSLKVLVSDDCGATFKTIYRNGGAELSTTTSGLGPDNLYEYDAFSPANCNEWREIQIDLSAYAGKYITLKIQNQSGYGNNMFIDDINFSGELISPVDAPGNLTFEASIQPNPAVDIARLKTSSSIEQPVEISLQSVSGQVLWRSKAIIGPSFREHVLPVGNLTAGVYLVKLNAEHGASKVFKLVVQK